jgi:hypothetical protein
MKAAYENPCTILDVAPGSRATQDNPTVVKVVTISSLYAQPTPEFIVVFRTAHHWIPSCATLIQSA